jgi:creatinine amidohydrolase
VGGQATIWDQLTSLQLAAVPKTISVILPIAATEQHGPHLSVAADHRLAAHFLSRLHTAIPDRALILPALPVGCSEHHQSFAGTLTLPTFAAVIVEILGSVAAQGFTKLVVFNAHGGNQASGGWRWI